MIRRCSRATCPIWHCNDPSIHICEHVIMLPFTAILIGFMLEALFAPERWAAVLALAALAVLWPYWFRRVRHVAFVTQAHAAGNWIINLEIAPKPVDDALARELATINGRILTPGATT